MGNSGIQKSHGGGKAFFSPVRFYQETPQTEARSSILTSRWRLYYMRLSRCAVLERPPRLRIWIQDLAGCILPYNKHFPPNLFYFKK